MPWRLNPDGSIAEPREWVEPSEASRQLLERLRAKYANDEPATDRWRDLGLQLDEVPDETPIDDDGMAALGRLFVLIERHRPAWQRDALCAEYPDLPWFPGKGEPVTACKAVCARCVVAEECRTYAAAEGITHGLLGRSGGPQARHPGCLEAHRGPKRRVSEIRAREIAEIRCIDAQRGPSRRNAPEALP